MRQRISYDSGDYGTSVFFWIILICAACFFIFWWPWGGTDYNTYGETANYVANNTVSGEWSWGWFWFWVVIGFLFVWWICALFYVPVGVDADDDEVRIRRPFKSKHLRMDEIASAEPYDVSKANPKRKFSSVPIRTFGRWGHYSDDNHNDYFAYYGKPDNTVLITLKDGRKYVVGGSNAKELSDYINSKKK